jgi:sialidase-1
MSANIAVDSTGLVYRNPAPHLRSLVAYHPSFVLGDANEFIVTFDTGQGIESLDYHTVLTRSRDAGATWALEGGVLNAPPPRTSHTLRINRMSDGSLVGIVAIFHREDPNVGLVNRATFGFVPMDLGLIRSTDRGKTWSAFEPLNPPLVGPSWEICHPVYELRNGRWLLPTATWRAWNGDNPSGEQTVAFISDDRGRTWPKFGLVFDGRKIARSRLEISVIQLPDGRVLAVGWVHDAKKCKNFPSEYAISDDHAETFSEPQQTGFEAETCKMVLLRDGRIFCAYRRADMPGLWGRVAEIKGSRWINLSEAPLWQGAATVTTSEENSADGLSALKFGYPSLQQLPNGQVFLVFWCQEACVTNIRWLRINIS